MQVRSYRWFYEDPLKIISLIARPRRGPTQRVGDEPRCLLSAAALTHPATLMWTALSPWGRSKIMKPVEVGCTSVFAYTCTQRARTYSSSSEWREQFFSFSSSYRKVFVAMQLLFLKIGEFKDKIADLSL